jgi:hypothetical protein
VKTRGREKAMKGKNNKKRYGERAEDRQRHERKGNVRRI